MGHTERLYTPPLDRTPYQSCFLVTFVVGVILILSTVLLWNLAGWVKHHRFFELPVGSFPNLSSQIQQASQSQADKAKQDLNQATQRAAEQAQQKIKQEADQQIQQQTTQLKTQGQQQLQQYLSK